MPDTAPFRCVVPIEVRFRDLDAMGHVNNAVYFTYFEIARTEYWRLMTGHLQVAGFTFVVARAACDYKSPVGLGETVEVRIRVPALRNSSFDFDYEIRARGDGRVVALGQTVQVSYDYENRRSLPIAPELRRRIETYEGTGALPDLARPTPAR